MSRSELFEPLKRSYRNWLRKRNRLLPGELPKPFFHAEDIRAVSEYFSAFAEEQKNERDLPHCIRGKCYVCKQQVDFAIELPRNGCDVNWRETLACPECGLINRWRSCLHVFEEVCQPAPNDRIYLTETLSPVHQNLSKRFPGLISSEYLPDAEFGYVTLRNEVPIRNEDVTSLSFADASLDIILCFDVLEHVSDYRSALAEFHRVLGPGGQLLLSVPVTYEQHTLVRAARSDDGKITHLVEPCYHGDPLSEQGVLSYYDFGMELLDDMHRAGFEECFALCFHSGEWGYLDDNVIFVARKLKSGIKKGTMAKQVWQAGGNQVSLLAEKTAELTRYLTGLFHRPSGRKTMQFRKESIVDRQILDRAMVPSADLARLPEIFHYWSNRHIASEMSRFGFGNPEDFLFNQTKSFVKESRNRRVNILSIGAGNGDLEINITRRLLQFQLDDFIIECLETDHEKLKTARKRVNEAGLNKYFRFTQADLNCWKPYRKYGVVIANQALHEAWNLEGLLDSVKWCMRADGRFIVSDTIGRNFNMCWPETMRAIKPFWNEMPQSYRYNRVLRRQEEQFINHDGTREGFGAIRSQDILPLLLERFNFGFFFPYGNIIFVFISQSFGHNFNADADWDRDFIDRVHARDEAGMLSGELKPGAMLAVLTKVQTDMVLRHPVLTPQYCVREFSDDHA